MAVVSLVTPHEDQVKSGLKEVVRELLGPLGGICIFPGEAVLLYLGHIWPAEAALGVNPRPALLSALVEIALEEGAGEVSVAARVAPSFGFQQSWQLAGYGILESYSVIVHDLGASPKGERESKLNLAYAKLAVAMPLLRADYLINVSKFRVAEGKLFGSALGNMAAACFDADHADKYPEIYSRALVDIHSIVAPDLHVLDALKGERGYQLQKQHAILAANDGVAMDATLTTLARLTAREVEHLALAAQYGLGAANAGDIHLVGDKTLELFSY